MVYIAPIYPAREVDDGRVSSEKLAEAITKNGVEAVGASFADIEIALQAATEGDVIITMGAGDIYKVSNALVA